VAITKDDVSTGGNRQMSFIQGAQGNGALGPEVTGSLPRSALDGLRSLPNLVDAFPHGGVGNTPTTQGTGGVTPDPKAPKVEGGLSLDDPHGPKTVDNVFKPHG